MARFASNYRIQQLAHALERVQAYRFPVTVTMRDKPEASPVSEMQPDVMAATTRAVHAHYPGVALVPYLESGGTDGKVYRTAGIPMFATSGSVSKPSQMFAHGLNERLPVTAFYHGLDHTKLERRSKELAGVTGSPKRPGSRIP